MARLALGTIGAAIGGFLFPGSQFALGIGFAIGSFVGSLLFPQKLPDIVGNRLDSLLINSSTYGAAIPIIFGAIRLGANIIWATDIKETRNEESTGGGKGGAPSQTVVSFTYSVSFEAAFAEGPAQAIVRIWANNKIIYDARDINQGPVTQFADSIRLYLGTETQLPDAEVEADKGIGNVPADRGIIKVHFDNLQLEDFGNALPQISAEIFMVSATAFPSKITDVDPDVPVGIQHNFDRSEVYGITHFNRVSAINSDLRIYALTMGFEFIRSSSIIKPSANSAPTGEVTIDVDEQLYITWFKDSTNDSWIEQIDGNTLVSVKITGYVGEVLPPLFAGNYTKINGVPATRTLYEGIGTNNTYHVWVGPDRGSVFNVPAVASDVNFMDPCIDGTGRAWYIGDDTVINTKKHILVLEGSNIVIYFNYTDSTGRNFKVGQNNQSIWHPQTNTILAAQTSGGSPTEGEILKLDIITGAILDRVVLPDNIIRFFASQREQSLKFINKSTIWYTTGDQYVEFDPVSME